MLEAQVKGKEIVVCPVSERGHNLLIHWLKQSSILRKNSLSLVSTKPLQCKAWTRNKRAKSNEKCKDEDIQKVPAYPTSDRAYHTSFYLQTTSFPTLAPFACFVRISGLTSLHVQFRNSLHQELIGKPE